MKVNLHSVIAGIDSYINCDFRNCEECESTFGTESCPQHIYRDELEKVLRILEQYFDLSGKVEVSEEELIDLLT